MEELDIIDPQTYSQLKDLMGADFIKELIDTYNVETGELIENLHQSLAHQDAISFGRQAHSIKSSSASLGALELARQARELEMLGKANDLAHVGEKLDRLATGFARVKQRLEELRNEP